MRERFIHILTRLFSIFPIKNIILMESVPDYSDNTYSLYKEFLKKGINEKYTIIWIASSGIGDRNVYSIDNSSLIGIVKMCYFIAVSKVIISCNYVFKKYRKHQINIFLNHAITYKRIRDYYTLNNTIDYNIVTSLTTRKIMSFQQNFDIEKTFAVGFPRNDELFHSVNMENVLGKAYNKVIVWYPTFRQHKAAINIVSEGLEAIPLITNEGNAKQINELLERYNICLVIKPHFAQDVSYIKNLNLSNILFITDDFFKRSGITSYEFVGNCDALLTDYSSIFIDYLLCDKPIGLIWSDKESYLKNPGLIDDYEYYARGTQKIYTLEELDKFITNIACSIDLYKEERNSLKREMHMVLTPNNSENVCNFIVTEIKKRDQSHD